MIIEPRASVSLLRSGLAPIWAVAGALALCAVLILWAGTPVHTAYWLLFKGAFGSAFAINETLTRSIPLIFTGLAAAVAFRAKFYNIGAEGQLYAGALATTFFGTGLVTLPPVLMVPFLMLVGALAGGALLIVPVLLKTRMKVDEVVTTLLLNFVVLLMVSNRVSCRSLWPRAACTWVCSSGLSRR
ncbi:MAG: ABC transporter permease [Alphaproteobacteria bacterium]